MQEAQNPPGASHRVTSEPLKNPITVGQAQRDEYSLNHYQDKYQIHRQLLQTCKLHLSDIHLTTFILYILHSNQCSVFIL